MLIGTRFNKFPYLAWVNVPPNKCPWALALVFMDPRGAVKLCGGWSSCLRFDLYDLRNMTDTEQKQGPGLKKYS